MKSKILLPFLVTSIFMLEGCTKEGDEMINVQENKAYSNTKITEEEEIQAPFVNINYVIPADYCDGTVSKYGVKFKLEPWTYYHYYTNTSQSVPGVNFIIKQGSINGPVVMQQLDVYCLGESDLRTTLNDFNCMAVGPVMSLAKNTTYFIRAYSGVFNSNWHQFTTPNTTPCAL